METEANPLAYQGRAILTVQGEDFIVDWEEILVFQYDHPICASCGCLIVPIGMAKKIEIIGVSVGAQGTWDIPLDRPIAIRLGNIVKKLLGDGLLQCWDSGCAAVRYKISLMEVLWTEVEKVFPEELVADDLWELA